MKWIVFLVIHIAQCGEYEQVTATLMVHSQSISIGLYTIHQEKHVYRKGWQNRISYLF